MDREFLREVVEAFGSAMDDFVLTGGMAFALFPEVARMFPETAGRELGHEPLVTEDMDLAVAREGTDREGNALLQSLRAAGYEGECTSSEDPPTFEYRSSQDPNRVIQLIAHRTGSANRARGHYESKAWLQSASRTSIASAPVQCSSTWTGSGCGSSILSPSSSRSC